MSNDPSEIFFNIIMYIYIYIYIMHILHIRVCMKMCVCVCVCVCVCMCVCIYRSEHLKWIKKVNKSCPNTRTGIVLVSGQLWWKGLIFRSSDVDYCVYIYNIYEWSEYIYIYLYRALLCIAVHPKCFTFIWYNHTYHTIIYCMYI